MRHISVLATLASLLAIVYFSCTPEVEDTPEKVNAEPVMREVSDLVLLMFKMEADLKEVRNQIEEDSVYTPLLADGFEAIYTAEASKDIQRDSAFIFKAGIYLGHIDQLVKTDNRDSALVYFNNAIATCVSCHQDYCPGPVARIKKLRIN